MPVCCCLQAPCNPQEPCCTADGQLQPAGYICGYVCAGGLLCSHCMFSSLLIGFYHKLQALCMCRCRYVPVAVKLGRYSFAYAS
jgi:hypothetical protein